MSDPVVPPGGYSSGGYPSGGYPGGYPPGYPGGQASPPVGPAPEEPSLHSERKATLIVGRVLGYAVYAYVIVAEIVLGLGFVLLLLGANPSAGFVEWVYRALDRAMQPFADIFAPLDLGLSGGNEVESVLDTSVLFAMLVYAIVGFGARALLDWLTVRIQHLDRDYAAYEREFQARAQYDAQVAAAQQQTPPTRPGAPPSP